MNDFKIVIEEDEEKKADIVTEVLLDLPEWFGIEESTADYVKKAEKYPLWVGMLDNQPIGFISFKETAKNVGEIYCMGVKRKYHQKKLGSQLFFELEAYAKKSYQFLQVKTVNQGLYKEYDQTILFYKSVGFTEFEVFPTLWDESNPCLILIKYIG